MAAPIATRGLALRKLTLTTLNQSLFKRAYTIQPPTWLGGRNRRKVKGKPHEEALSFAEKVAAHAPPPEPEINIGVDLQFPRPSKSQVISVSLKARRDKEKERAARLQQLVIPLDEVSEDWGEEFGPFHNRTVAEHYGIYKDLFNGAFFYPVLVVSVAYDHDEETVLPVYRGNYITPRQTQKAPAVEFEAEEGSLWTVLMVNPDGHLTDNSAEYLHWAIGNIPAGDLSSGDVLCNYLQPFPPRGTGFHRHVFLVFQQSSNIDFSQEMIKETNVPSLEARTFSTFEFYKRHEKQLTPLGLAFFQCEWDPSVKDVYHHVLDMKEPAFEYKHPPPYHPPQEMYPYRQPFDRYFDRYRDTKELAEEALRIKMSRISPFKSYTSPKYPLIHTHPWKKPSWLIRKEELIARKIEHFKDLP